LLNVVKLCHSRGALPLVIRGSLQRHIGVLLNAGHDIDKMIEPTSTTHAVKLTIGKFCPGTIHWRTPRLG
jgi:hypothetical protein